MRTEGIRLVCLECLGLVYFTMQVKTDISPVLKHSLFIHSNRMNYYVYLFYFVFLFILSFKIVIFSLFICSFFYIPCLCLNYGIDVVVKSHFHVAAKEHLILNFILDLSNIDFL